MLQIDANNNIILTRGDTLTLTVELTKDGQPYTPEEGDVIRFAVSNVYKTQFGYECLISKTIPNDTLTFTVPSDETELDYKEYVYDIEVTHSDGCVDTFISARLKITGEVK